MFKTTSANPLRFIVSILEFMAIMSMTISSTFSHTSFTSLAICGSLIDESLVTVKNNKLVFNGLTKEQQSLGYSILGIIEDASKGEVQILEDFQIEYQPSLNICDNSDLFSYVITDGAVESVKKVSVEILCESLAILSSMSPNGDGKQDNFVILGIEDYPNNELVIFNDLGLEIFRKQNYTNDWDGTYHGNPLPKGVYYYVFKPSNHDVLSGYLYMDEDPFR